MKSDWVGLNRKITVYEGGKAVREWSGQVKVEYQGSVARFMINGKAISISGTYIIEEL